MGCVSDGGGSRQDSDLNKMEGKGERNTCAELPSVRLPFLAWKHVGVELHFLYARAHHPHTEEKVMPDSTKEAHSTPRGPEQ